MMNCCRAESIFRSRTSGCENASWSPTARPVRSCSAGCCWSCVRRPTTRSRCPLPHGRRCRTPVDENQSPRRRRGRRERSSSAARRCSIGQRRQKSGVIGVRGFRRHARPRPRCRAGRWPGRDCGRSRAARHRRASAAALAVASAAAAMSGRAPGPTDASRTRESDEDEYAVIFIMTPPPVLESESRSSASRRSAACARARST